MSDDAKKPIRNKTPNPQVDNAPKPPTEEVKKPNPAELFKTTVENKIQSIITEFAEGKISREQFQVIYARYSEQLAIANAALMTG
ncbi:MAG TPA: hypothetical protein PLZ51_20485, partial [Aggregatilineales bacterium]|nr:hypothetical protein [Aggregatilineales bacterium]